MATDTKVAAKFYANVLGWTTADAGMPDRSYTLISAGATQLAGLMPMPEDLCKMGVAPHWIGYISVPDVDAAARHATAAGGKIHRAGEDIPGVGRFAVAADPDGAAFVLFAPDSSAQPKPVAPDTPGHVGWHELRAGNPDTAFAFYSKLFGWTKGEAIDMGPMGVYQMFDIDGVTVGGMMRKAPEMASPHWLYYFNVATLDAAVARVTKGKGKVLAEPRQVPGGHWIASCTDPEGAHFALVSPKR